MIVIASAISASSTGPTISPDPAVAEASSIWSINLGFAFSFAETPTTLYPAAVQAQSIATGPIQLGTNLDTIFADALSQQSEIVAPPPPSGQQITFHWSM